MSASNRTSAEEDVVKRRLNDKTPEDIATVWIKHLFSMTNIDAIVTIWTKFSPLGADAGAIASTETILSTLLYAPIDVVFFADSIQLFSGAATLRIPKNQIHGTALRCVDIMEKNPTSKRFFEQPTQMMYGSGYKMQKFKFNQIVSDNLDRSRIVIYIITKTLLIAVQLENGRYYLDTITILMASLKNIAFTYSKTNRPGVKTLTGVSPTSDHASSGLLLFIDLLESPELLRIISALERNIAKRKRNENE